jgi:hypothetical protein
VPWTLKIRVGPLVERLRFDQLEPALDELEARAKELAASAPNEPAGGRVKRYEPIQQVFARIELSGPERWFASVRAGLDVRGDGSVEAFVGRLTRTPLEPQDGETPYDALRRTAGSSTESGSPRGA